jgi:prophage DNA circulation protein
MAEAPEQTWRDKMQPASFRGVPFKVVSSDRQIGRRAVVHEYPQRDLPYAEDMGRKAREFTVEALIIGPDYMTGRDKLEEALEAAGSGELVHPYRGRIQVVVSSPARISESTAEGGMARFSITFTESGEPVNPAPRADTGAAVEAAADEAQAETESSFADMFSVDGLQDFVPTEALATVNDALDGVMDAANGIMDGSLLPEFTQQLFSISSTVSSLMSFPANLASGLFGQIASLSAIASNPLGSLSALSSIFGSGSRSGSGIQASSASPSNSVTGSGSPTSAVSVGALTAVSVLRPLFSFGSTAKPVPHSVPPTAAAPTLIATPSRIQQAANQAAVINLTRQAAVIEAARVSAKITPASFGEAVALRDEIAGQLETLAETAPDNVYAVLSNLRIAVIKDITTRAADLSSTVQYPVPVTQPALVIAHHLYGDVEQADAMVARNKIRHPGFVPGGRTIEVLTS